MFTATYDRKQRLYLVPLPTGETLSAHTRPDAEWAYLTAIAPEIAAKAQSILAANPLLADRVRRACFIAVEGEITPCNEPVVYGSQNYAFTRVARVSSQRSAENVYQILVRDHRFYCDCVDAQGVTTPEGTEEAKAPPSKVSDHTCKHILALLLSDD
jgi:hypothetical protein